MTSENKNQQLGIFETREGASSVQLSDLQDKEPSRIRRLVWSFILGLGWAGSLVLYLGPLRSLGVCWMFVLPLVIILAAVANRLWLHPIRVLGCSQSRRLRLLSGPSS